MRNLFKNKKGLFIIGGILLVIVLAVILFFTLKDKNYVITFNTDGGSKVKSITVKENEVVTLPVDVTKEGYIFNGWTNEEDKAVNNKYTVVKSITLKANWISNEAETFTVTFDSAGGTNVDKIIVIKGETLKLPENPTKEGYTFVSWVDSNEIPIYDDALLEGDITLTATWIEKENSKVTYSCPSGYTLSDTVCTIEGTVHETCPSGTHEYEGTCVTVSNSVRVDSTKVCGKTTVLTDGNGHTAEVQGILTNEGLDLCYYYKLNTSDKTTCTSQSHVWSTSLNGCYVQRDKNYTSSCSSNYVYLSNPNAYVTNTGLNGGCFPTSPKNKYCDNDYAYNSSTDKCIKTINATLE